MTSATVHSDDDSDLRFMRRALELAYRGEGHVEPNPMVGCVIVRAGEIVGEGWHTKYGEPHAEIEALRVAGTAAVGATVYVTLEPCCHVGKTPPCSRAIIEAGVSRVVVGCQDPNPQVSGGGLAELRAKGIHLEVGLLAEQIQQCLAPFHKLVMKQRPWIIAKWAMTLDGKIATCAGSSQWISNARSRTVVHQLRGRVDAILVGRGTLEHDNPLLTARIVSGDPGMPDTQRALARTATRVVLDTHASLSPQSQLARTASQIPVLVAVSEDASIDRCKTLEQMGIEVARIPKSGDSRLGQGICMEKLLDLLGQRNMTNVLVEGGAQVLGTLLTLGEIDEVYTFVATKLVGGATAPSPMAGPGVEQMMDARKLSLVEVEVLEGDIYVRARMR
ncbi:MAG: bifunctional diaminohydroxyphosphoribosylaminopyrimidine deaminase/5-amino-6-(5-phosphoribosylamino)uracil reductase RibD [Pirellulales bacterium]